MYFFCISWKRLRKKLQATNVIMRLAFRLFWLDIPLSVFIFYTRFNVGFSSTESHSVLGVITQAQSHLCLLISLWWKLFYKAIHCFAFLPLMLTHKRALWEKNQCCSNLVFLYVMNKTVVWSPKNHEILMFVMFSHGVFNWDKLMLKPEEKYVCCICYWKLSAGEGNGWHSSMHESRVFIQYFTNSLLHRKNC